MLWPRSILSVPFSRFFRNCPGTRLPLPDSSLPVLRHPATVPVPTPTSAVVKSTRAARRPVISGRHSGRDGFSGGGVTDAAVNDQTAPAAGLDDPVHDLPLGPDMSASGNLGAGLVTAPYQRPDHCHVDGFLIAHDWLLAAVVHRVSAKGPRLGSSVDGEGTGAVAAAVRLRPLALACLSNGISRLSVLAFKASTRSAKNASVPNAGRGFASGIGGKIPEVLAWVKPEIKKKRN